MRFLIVSALAFLLVLFEAPAFSAEESASLEALQGKWSAKRPEGETRSLEFNRDKVTFEIVGSDGQIRALARGSVKAVSLSPFKVLQVSNVQIGRSADDLKPSEEELSFVYTFHEGSLVVANNFDKARDRQKPDLIVYNRLSSPNSKITGTWKLELEFADNTYDYTLRIAESGGNLSAVLVSPRSGEHKVKTVKLNGDAFTMEIDRELENNPVTFVYHGKLAGDTLSGECNLKGAGQDASGTWKAKRYRVNGK
jgi:hypothetical protein